MQYSSLVPIPTMRCWVWGDFAWTPIVITSAPMSLPWWQHVLKWVHVCAEYFSMRSRDRHIGLGLLQRQPLRQTSILILHHIIFVAKIGGDGLLPERDRRVSVPTLVKIYRNTYWLAGCELWSGGSRSIRACPRDRL